LDAKGDINKLCIYWCAKEAIFKMMKKPLKSLLDIQIMPFYAQKKGIVWAYVARDQIYYPCIYRMESLYTLAVCTDTLLDDALFRFS
jgi:hypothetical protein